MCCFGLGLALLVPTLANAQHHYINVASGSDCVIQEYRKPVLTPGIYDALYMSWNVPSTEGNPSSGWYGGPVHDLGNNRTLVQYSFWPSSIAYPAGAVQRFVFAGTNMSWHVSIGEGTVGGISGYWPLFQTNQWYRFVVRYWQPSDGTPHVGYQGMWMKDPVTGNWHHQGTVQYAFGATGVDGLSGFQENFVGSSAAHRADYRNAYYHKGGSWQPARQFSSDGFNGNLELAEGGTAVFSQSWGGDTSALPANLRGTSGLAVTAANQPAAPTFDPIVVANATASCIGTQLVVKWELPLTSSPQLSYKIEVFDNPAYTGAAAVTFSENDPDLRQKMLTIPAMASPAARLTITDIFFNTGTPVPLAVAGVALNAATNASGTVGGLGYRYYQAASGVNWSSIPNLAPLVPVLRGAVSTVDLTPRQRRSNYAFDYSGFLNAPADGIYSFSLRAGNGSRLLIDGAVVVNHDGLRNSTETSSGWVGLRAGLHSLNVQYFQGSDASLLDGLGLYYEGPGLARTEIPASAFSRIPGAGEPTIAITSPAGGAVVPSSSPGFGATVSANGATVNRVQFYLTDFYSYFHRPNQGVDYYLGQDASAPYALNNMVWAAPTNLVRARLVYNQTNTIDSAPVSFATTNPVLAPWYWSPMEVHNYPSGASVEGNKLTLLGDGMNLLSRRVTGDCTLIGRLASITPGTAGPDGIAPDGDWRAGIILRGTTNSTVGQPLGDGGTTRFAALFSPVGGGTYFEDDTMRNGNGDANRWSGNLGGGNKWYKLQRLGDSFLSSVSMDGVNWTVVNSNLLTGIGATIHAGVFIHAVQSQNPNIHIASFDSLSLTGTNIYGPASVSISPQTNAVVGGLPASFSASVIGPVPPSYQWQYNGATIQGATNATLTIGSAGPGDAGLYTVVASGVTSAPAILIISVPAGSGVWTNAGGGSWTTGINWSGGFIAGGVDAVADFSTRSLNANATVTLDGARSMGTFVFDDLNGVAKHNWTLSTGTGGPLTLAVGSGTPGIAVKSATNIISAAVAGTQGFSKTGAGQLTLSGLSTITGTVSVNAGTLEVQSKSGDTPYAVAQGATLRLGYSTGGGYANTGLSISGSGVASTAGLYLLGGRNYNASGQIVLLAGPTSIRQYGSGLAGIGMFDINGNGLWCTAAASGSVIETNIQMISSGYGMSMQIDAGTNGATGDLVINGPLNVGSLGFYKRGAGTLLLKGAATSGNTALNIQGGAVLCGAVNCIGANASVPVSAGAGLLLNGFNQNIASLNVAADGTVSFGGTNTLTVSSAPTLAGVLRMAVSKGGTPSASRLVLPAGTLTLGGSLVVTNVGSGPLAPGDAFTLFSAPGYAGTFSSVILPVLPIGLIWNTTNLPVSGSISITTNGLSQWNGGGTNAYWSTPENWGGSAPGNGQLLSFQGVVRQTSTNNLLGSVGRVAFANGGFTLSGNPVTLQWGLLNQAGNNAWTIASTLGAPQSFISSNGTLTISGAVANGGFDLGLDGAGSHALSGVLSGTGALVKSGAGTASISVQSTHTGGTIVNGGILNLTGGGGSSGTIRGTATINGGGTLQLSTGDATGYGGGASALTTINVAGGTLQVNTTVNQTLGSAVINLTGGSISGNAGGNLDFFGGASALNTLPSATTASISGVPISPLRQGSTTFTVAQGTTPSGIDLDVSSVLRTSPSGDAAGAVLIKAGAGTMRLSAVNTYARPTAVNGGTLLVSGSLAAGSTVTVAPGAALGGTGTLKGPVTVAAGATLAPGNKDLGTLTFNSSLTLAGNVVMELLKQGASLTNDMISISTGLAFGGTLTVTNRGVNALEPGDSFKLFSAPSYSGAFTSNSLPPLSANLVWDLSKLVTSGTILVGALPAVVRQPQEVIVSSGSPATFSAEFSGSPTLVWQWRRNGVAIPGATSTSYTIPSATAVDAGAYSVVVTNGYGSAASQSAALIVRSVEAPRITGITPGIGGGIDLSCKGTPGQPYLLLTSSNLVQPNAWISAGVDQADTNGTFRFFDSLPANAPRRFYRLQSQ